MNRTDDQGTFWDTLLDVGFALYSAWQAVRDPSPDNWLALGADVACIVVPFASGGGAAVRAAAKYGDDVLSAAKAGDNVVDAGKSFNRVENAGDTTYDAGRGFDTFSKAKYELGPAGKNKHWHHIVEQCQIKKSGFSPQQIHNTSNLVAVDDSVHVQITAYYNKKHNFTNGLRYRDWLAGQSFEFQYLEGIRVMKLFE